MNDGKKYTTIISSTHVDRHGDMMTKEALVQMASMINNQVKRVRMGVDHRRDYPPKGRLENAVVIERNGYYYLEADYCIYSFSETPEWNSSLLMEYFENDFQFSEVNDEVINEAHIFIDRQNFRTQGDVDELVNEIENDYDIDVGFHGRKSLIPDPEVIFQFAATGIFYHLIKPTIKKIGEKIADDLAEKTYQLIKKATSKIFSKALPKNQPVVVVFDIPGKPHIELIGRTRDQKLLLKSLTEKKLIRVRNKIEDLNKNTSISKIQFLLNKKGSWKFNYLITEHGATIGTKASFKKRDKKFEKIIKK